MRSLFQLIATPSSPAESRTDAVDAAARGCTAAIHVELIEAQSDIPLSAEQWNELVTHNETNSIFQTHQWFDTWWRTFGAAHGLFFLLIRNDRDIVGFAPLMVRRGRLGWRRLQFVGTGNADYQDIVVLPEHKPAALRSICSFLSEHDSRWDSLWLSNVPSQSSTLFHLRSRGAEFGLRLVEQARSRCPALQLLPDRSGAEKLLGKYRLKRPLNWFTARGEVGFRHVASPIEIQKLLPAFFEQHVRRWRAAGHASLFETSAQRAFYVSLAAALHSAGWLLFSVVEFNGQPIAFHFGFDYFGSIIWYKPSFEIRYAEHSPGLLLIRKLIEDGLQRSRRELDFTIGEESFKDRFANVSRFNSTVSVYHSLPSALGAGSWRWLRRTLGRARAGLLAGRASVKNVLHTKADSQ
jgi:CelD/BcsL family acetyltransferase involved in cellulose biosynthesis